MQPQNKNRFLIACCMVASSLLPGIVYAEAVITHPALVMERIDKETLRAVMSMRLRTWEDGTPVRVFVLPDRHPSHQRFVKETLNLFPHQLRRTWDRLVFAGIGQAPVELPNARAMLRQVATTPGAIGYLEEDIIDDSVRQLIVD